MSRRMKAVLLVFALVLAATASPAAAARGGKNGGGGGGDVTGTIDLMAPAGAAAAGATAGPQYGSTVEFDTEVQGDLAAKSSVYVTVVCTQGDTVVYQASGPEGTVFPLEDQAGQGLDWHGGDADCTGTLIYRVKKGKSSTITWLDIEAFTAQGA